MSRSLSSLSFFGFLALAACGGASSSNFSDGSGGGDAGGGGAGTSTATGEGTTSTETGSGTSSSSGAGGGVTSGGGGEGGLGAGGGGATVSSSSGGAGCQEISVRDLSWLQTSLYTAPIATNVDGPEPDQLEVAFFTTNYDGAPISPSGDQPGTFDLAEEPSWFDCGHCVLALVDPDSLGNATKVYFAESGTITLEAAGNDVLEGAATFSLSNVVLREALIDFGTGETELIPGGDCLYLESHEYDQPAG